MDSMYFSNRRQEANKQFRNFEGSVDPTCQSFNDGTMFEEFDGFSGIASNELSGFENASGCNSYNASGRTLSAEKSNPVMDGRYANVGTKPPRSYTYPTIGETYLERQTGGGNPTLDPYGRKSRRTSADRVSVNPVGGVQRESGGCKPTKCGQHHSASCPAGCHCSSTLNGVCEGGGSGAGSGAKVKQGGMNFSSYTNFVNPSRGFRASSNFNGGASRCALDR